MPAPKLSALFATAVVCALLLRPAPARAGEAATADFSSIAGTWAAHGFVLQIGDDGQAVAHWRVYAWCQDLTAPAPCDSIIGNEIVDGGLAMLRFTDDDGSTASSTVLMSSDPSTLASGAQISLQLMPGGVAQLSGLSSGNSFLVCGPNLDRTSYPTYPCGA